MKAAKHSDANAADSIDRRQASQRLNERGLKNQNDTPESYEQPAAEGSAPVDTVGWYLKRMGRVPLHTREQEAAIWQQVEAAERNALEHIHHLGFITREYLDLAQRLIDRQERFESVVEVATGSRERYMEALPELCVALENAARKCDAAYTSYLARKGGDQEARAFDAFTKARSAVLKTYPGFCFKPSAVLGFAETVEKENDSLRKAKCECEESDTPSNGRPEQQKRMWMSREEFFATCRELKMWLARANKCRAEMVEANLRLVIMVAKAFTCGNVAFLDLIQEGNIGLMKAVEKFDYRRGHRFSTYACFWIRQRIARCVAELSQTIHVPLHMIATITKMLGVQRQLAQELARDPSPEEVAAEIQMPVERVRTILRMGQATVSLQTLLGDSDDECLGDLIEDPSAEMPGTAATIASLKEEIEDVLRTLSDTERMIVEYRFGFMDGHKRTLEEVGHKFMLTRERIRQIEIKALRKLRHSSRIQRLEGFRDWRADSACGSPARL